tara:strand:- start:8855 stop:9634 length:780 start_codon:yes stop_codon:yes gene_type:complete
MTRKFKKLFYFLYCSLFYEKDKFKNQQEEIFKRNNLDRFIAKKNLDTIIKKNNLSVSEMVSEHEVIFSSLSLDKNIKVDRILEIGTYDGSNAVLLSELFPNSQIITVDLPSKDDEFNKTYKRNNLDFQNEFIKSRNEKLSRLKNVEFIEMNSINLINEKKTFDLIWIDGAHGYPIVTIDIINSLRLCNLNGLILCDDVYVKKIKNQDPYYFSNATFETIKILKSQKLINYDLFLKRIDNKFNYFPIEKKYIAFIKKFNI